MPGTIDVNQLLLAIEKMLHEQPERRAEIIRRLRESNPSLYAVWLARTVEVPKGEAFQLPTEHLPSREKS